MFWKIFFDSLILIGIMLAIGWIVARFIARTKSFSDDSDSDS